METPILIASFLLVPVIVYFGLWFALRRGTDRRLLLLAGGVLAAGLVLCGFVIDLQRPSPPPDSPAPLPDWQIGLVLGAGIFVETAIVIAVLGTAKNRRHPEPS